MPPKSLRHKRDDSDISSQENFNLPSSPSSFASSLPSPRGFADWPLLVGLLCEPAGCVRAGGLQGSAAPSGVLCWGSPGAWFTSGERGQKGHSEDVIVVNVSDESNWSKGVDLSVVTLLLSAFFLTRKLVGVENCFLSVVSALHWSPQPSCCQYRTSRFCK